LNLNVHYRVHKSPPFVPILSHMKSVQPPHPNSHWYISILSTYLCLGLPCGFFPFGFHTNNIYAFQFPHSSYMPCPSYPPWLYLLITPGKEYKSHHAVFSNLPSLHPPFSPNILLSPLFSNSLRSSLTDRDKVLHTYRTTSKMLVLYILILFLHIVHSLT
jgi:hypothetical protein